MEYFWIELKNALAFIIPYITAGIILFALISEIALVWDKFKSLTIRFKVFVIINLVIMIALIIVCIIIGHREVERRWFN